MKFFLSLFVFLLSVLSATAQIQPAAEDCFPSRSDFVELQSVSLSEKFADRAQLSRVNNGKLISDVGFQKYARCAYSLGGSKSLSIEIVTLLDMQAAYSLLTLVGNSSLQAGPPGDEYFADADRIQFSHGNKWINIQCRGVPRELARRVAIFVSDRLGPRRQKRPALVSHFPKSGYDASTLKYFPGFRSFKTYTKKLPSWIGRCGEDMEIAQASYSTGDCAGRLSLMSFPTQELAEECFSKLASPSFPEGRDGMHTKTSGPLVGILEGAMDAGSAKKVLDSIQYSYSVNWIYEKDAKSVKNAKPKSVWGIPHSILDTVVKSIFLVVLLALLSIGVGIVFAVVRFRSRSRKPAHALDDEFTHLRMR